MQSSTDTDNAVFIESSSSSSSSKPTKSAKKAQKPVSEESLAQKHRLNGSSTKKTLGKESRDSVENEDSPVSYIPNTPQRTVRCSVNHYTCYKFRSNYR